MTPVALILITFSAFAHAFWNFLSKRRSPSAGFFWIATLAAVVVLLPAVWLFRHGLSFLSPITWALVAITGVCQAVYYIGLAGAYSRGDLSLAYPLVRSLPVLFIALANVVLGRIEQIGPWAFVGFAGVVMGCLMLPLPSFRGVRLGVYVNRFSFYAIMAACSTVGYTLADDQALHILRSIPGMPLENWAITLLYLGLENISLAVFLGLYVFSSREERQMIRLQGRSLSGSALTTGLVMTGAYGLVLLAMAHVRNVSYVSAFRQISLPIGALLGVRFGSERWYIPRVVGLVVILIGLVLVALG